MTENISAFLTARFGKLDAQGKFWMWCGLVTLAISMGMAYDYGSQVTWKHGGVMAALSLGTAFVLEEAYSYYRRGLYGVAIGFTLIAMPLFWQEAKSHIAYTAGFRTASVEKVKVQNTKYNGAQDTVQENKDQLAFWQKRLDTLTTQNGWTATVTADGLRAKLPGLELAIQQEAAAGGCKAKCLARTKERDEIAERIKVLEETNDLSAKIAHAKQVLGNLRDKASTVEHQTSIVEHQTDFLQKTAAFILGGKDGKANPVLAEGVDIENTVSLALMPVILPALFFFMMGLRRKEEDEASPAEPIATIPPVEQRYAPPPAVRPFRSAISTLSVADLIAQQKAAA